MSTGSQLSHTVDDGLDLIFEIFQVVVSPTLGNFDGPTSKDFEKSLYVHSDDVWG
jgi:hypothetical protein